MKNKLLGLLVFIAAFLSFIVFSGCENKDLDLSGAWEISALIKENIYQEIAISYIEFEGNGSIVKVHGDSGVNLFNGTVKIKGNRFSAENFASTKMLGSPRVEEFEQLFLETIMNADFIDVQNDVLVIRADRIQQELQFHKIKSE